MSITVLDRPEVIHLVEQGNNKLKLRAADIFNDWEIRCDVVVMARIIHDWNDSLAIQILSNARKTLPRGGKVFLVEMILPENKATGGLCSLHLFVSSGGKERTENEYKFLLRESGFEFNEVRQFSALLSIIVGVAR